MHIDLCFSTTEEEGKTLSPDRLAEAIVDFKESLGGFLEGFEVMNADKDEDAGDVQNAIFTIEALREERDAAGKEVSEIDLNEYERMLYEDYEKSINDGQSIVLAIANLHRKWDRDIFNVRDEFWDFLA